ncbi:site-specific DNA-methyltransferase [Gemmata sp. JC673]|uniref:site-specific DNA-methyltransferase (cytosine-N(4)-specific) n=1 Tax=Gemmata algarum TaxID=2975278 RepID=A0ABU5F5L9_9BACT|nr:hypothetical protein [Gemmata algarum]MDY3562881.1 site-specific DNA-methyltransferase [Gemmata algarum]
MGRLKKQQPSLFEGLEPEEAKADRSSTFLDNLSLPVHRWFRYSAGFSAEWVREVIGDGKAEGRKRVFDPFAGSGTVVLEAEAAQLDGIGTDSHPFVFRVAQAKLDWRTNPADLTAIGAEIVTRAKRYKSHSRTYPELLTKCYPEGTLHRLEALRRSLLESTDDRAVCRLAWLALVAILRECSPVGTAQWQYVLPKKSKAKSLDPFEAYAAKVRLFAADMAARQRAPHGPEGRINADDARKLSTVPDQWAELVVTSPPYANNYDYADATRLEMTFFGEIEGWGGLQEQVRRHLVHACTQHVTPLIKKTDELIADPVVDAISDELKEVCGKLGAERQTRGGKKAYHTMVAAYFLDMGTVWQSLRRVSAPGCRVCFVVGDSAPYGVYVPVDRWLGELAVAAGFKSFRFEKTRDRNTKWKNRKHRVPLHEGRLWVEG